LPLPGRPAITTNVLSEVERMGLHSKVANDGARRAFPGL
jgi:hypothetical protein